MSLSKRSLQDRLNETVRRPTEDARRPGEGRGPAETDRSLKSRLQSLIDQRVGRSRAEATLDDAESTPFSEDDVRSLHAQLNRRLSGSSTKSALPGESIETPHGSFHRRDEVYRLTARVGRVTLERLVNAPAEAARVLTASTTLDGFDPYRSAFIDTETTGLSGGAGTAAFLIAIGFLSRDERNEQTSFVVRQYFMRDFHEERAVIRSVEKDLEPFDTIVSFNGKQFDVPLLESRFRLQRRKFPQIDRHLDLLHPARRLWKARLESCSLQSLERGVLGLHREDDVGGELIPLRYFEWVRAREADLITGVMEHNLQDVVSLAALTGEALRLVTDENEFPDDARDALSLGRVLQRADIDERSLGMFRTLAETASGRTRIDAIVRLADHAKARKAHDEAEHRWRQAAQLGHFDAYRELAILLEHRRKDRAEALALVEMALELIAGEWQHARLEEDLLKRRERLSAPRRSRARRATARTS